ncbi:hypothetical protein QTN25_004599 [Entamoeba marina]
MNNSFCDLKNLIDAMNNKLKETEKEVNTTELEQVKDLLQKYDIVLKDNVDEMDLILKYETFYGQINEFVTNKRNDIVETNVYNNILKELDTMKVERYNVDIEIIIINNSMNVSKEWSNKSKFKIIFDSKVDGDGLTDYILLDRINNSGWIKDNNAFVFSLNRDGKVKNTKYSIKSKHSYGALHVCGNSQNNYRIISIW